MIGAHRNQDGEFHVRRDEHPTKRKNPGGGDVYVARATTKDGRRSYGTFAKKGPCKTPAADGKCCAQHRIYWAYEQDATRPATVGTIGGYADQWLQLHPRSDRTDATHRGRLRAVLPLDLGSGPLRDMLFADVDRMHAVKLADILLRDQGRAAAGARAITGTLTAMWRDALDDGWTRTASPFLGLRIRVTDPRVQKAARKPRVWSWEDMHAICAAAGPREAMLRLLSDCGLRLGEVFPVHRADVKLGAACDEAPECIATGPHIHVRWRAWKTSAYAGTKSGGGERTAPLPPALAGLLAQVPMPIRPDGLMFPAPNGRIWWEPDWRRGVWALACARAGLEGARPHDFRHSWVSLMRAAGVDPVDVAEIAGHSVAVSTRTYTHALNRSDDAMRRAVGG